MFINPEYLVVLARGPMTSKSGQLTANVPQLFFFFFEAYRLQD